jgi:hypothetical protein
MVKVNRENEARLKYEILQELLDYNPITGVFTWKVMMSSTALADAVAGSKNPRGYTQIRINGIKYYAHRLAWFYIYKKWPEDQIDHIDQNKENNAINNLRDVNHSTNMYNTSLRSHNTSGARGVHRCSRGNPWEAYITIDKKRIRIGAFVDFQSAVEARRKAEIKYGK